MNEDIKYILLEIRQNLINGGHVCSFPAYNTKTSIWEMKSKRLVFHAYFGDNTVVLESLTKGGLWGRFTAESTNKLIKYNLLNVTAQLIMGINKAL